MTHQRNNASQEAHDQALRQTLEGVYGGHDEYLEWIISKYKEYYDLPVIEKEEEIPAQLFHLYRKGRHFVVVAAFNGAGEILIIKDDAQTQTDWQLLGGFVKEDEAVEDVCDRVVHLKTGLNIDEFRPLAVVINRFTCHRRVLEHYGLAFIVSTRGTLALPPNHLGAYISQPVEQLAYANREVFALAAERIRDWQTFVPEDEIDANRKNSASYSFHELFVKQLFEPFSSRLLKNRINELCSGAETIIDVACGDDSQVLNLASSAKFCVANDISWAALKRLRQKNRQGNVIFTNHDATCLPFRRKFDVAICKNLLHHSHNRSELLAILENLKHVGTKLIVVDVENPLKSTWRARIWNAYYVRFLGDRGRYFLNKSEFERVISLVFRDASISFEEVQTIKGVYMIAVVENA